MKIVFIGSVNFSKSALEYLLKIGVDIAGVCTKKSNVGNSDSFDLGLISTPNRIPTLHTSNINSKESVDWIRELSPDYIFCLGWSQLLRGQLLKVPRLGVIGYHPSILPQNRGRHPLIWAIALGLSKTGSTFFLIDEGVDSGDIVSQRTVEILPEDNATSLYEKITEIALLQLSEIISQMEENSLKRKSQLTLKSNTWRKRTTQDGIIDWRMSAKNIHNLVRSLTYPYVGAQFVHYGETVKVWRSSILPDQNPNFEPGKVVRLDELGVEIKCGEGILRIEVTEPPQWRPKGEYL